LLAYGGMVPLALEALDVLAKQEKLNLALAAPTQLSPMPVSAFKSIVGEASEADTTTFITLEERPLPGAGGRGDRHD